MTRRYSARRPGRARWELNCLEDRLVPDGGGHLALPPVQIPPTANDDVAVTDGNAPVRVVVLGNDAAAAGRTLDPSSLEVVAQPTRGVVSVDTASGTIVYTATGFFRGTDTFRYTVRDTTGASSSPATVTVVTNRPVANDDFTDTPAATPVDVDVMENDSDPHGSGQIDDSSVRIVVLPGHGAVAIDTATGDVTYTPDPDFVGTDTFQYTVTDAAGAESLPATVTVVVGETTPPAALRAGDDAIDTDGNNPVTVPVLDNDSAAPGQTLDPSSVRVVSVPSRGTVSVDPATGEITYTATGFFQGTDKFQYTVRDSSGAESAPGDVTVVINRPTANDDVAIADTGAGGPVTISVLANDTDPDGNDEIDPGSVTIVSAPTHGSVFVSGSGVVTYVPNATFKGTDSFQYTITDFPGAVSSPGTVSIVVNRPFAYDDSASTFGSSPVPIPVLANDTDPGGSGQLNPATVRIVSGPAHGSVAVNPANGVVTYFPDGNFIGTDLFTYTVTDFAGLVSNVATVRVRVDSAKGDQFTVTGADAGGGPRVDVYNPDGSLKASFFAFEPTFTGGVRVAVADVTGDGVPDIIAGAGKGGGPRVRVFDGKTLASIADFFAYAPSFTGGVTVAGGDTNGDGRAEVITGAGVGGGPHVEVFDGTTGELLFGFFAFDPSFRGGVTVGAGDADGDGRADIAVGAGEGGGPQVGVFSGTTGALIRTFFAFDPSLRTGVNVALADTNADGTADLIAGAGQGGGPQVAEFDGTTGSEMRTFFAYDSSVRTGARVSAADVNQDGRVDLLVGPGAGQPLPVLALNGPTLDQIDDTQPFGGFRGGVFVGGVG